MYHIIMMSCPTRIAVFYLVFILKFVITCDFSFFLSKESKVCYDEECKNQVISELVLQEEGSICFTSENGDNIRYEIVSMTETDEYSKVYEACTPKVNNQTLYHCWWADECTYDKCTPTNTKSKAFKRHLNNSIYYYSGCLNANKCRGYCFYDQDVRCGWIQVEINTDTCYPVFEKSSKYWSVEIKKTVNDKDVIFSLSKMSPLDKSTQLIVTGIIIHNNELRREKTILQTPDGRHY